MISCVAQGLNLFSQLFQTVFMLPDAILHFVDYLCIQFAIIGQANIFKYYLQSLRNFSFFEYEHQPYS
jgi:hypothetical protein